MTPAEPCKLTLVSEHPPLLAAFYEQVELWDLLARTPGREKGVEALGE